MPKTINRAKVLAGNENKVLDASLRTYDKGSPTTRKNERLWVMLTKVELNVSFENYSKVLQDLFQILVNLKSFAYYFYIYCYFPSFLSQLKGGHVLAKPRWVNLPFPHIEMYTSHPARVANRIRKVQEIRT